ncbi:MAG TPA: VIT1/CCC1 transporter family protein [Candidatus Dormibacteraeota bacterium]|nr:VIT1/CCC1 transporter family protein [Candidatus Dormibacteraeota bacterium]
MTTPHSIEQSLENLKLERDAIWLYDRLASVEKDPRRSAAFRTIAGNERRHADIWARALEGQGASVPPPGSPRLRVRFIAYLASVLGTRAVSDLVKALEGDEEDIYGQQAPTPEVASIAADEREHAEIWKRLDMDARDGDEPGTSLPAPVVSPERDGGGAASSGVAPSDRTAAPGGLAPSEQATASASRSSSKLRAIAPRGAEDMLAAHGGSPGPDILSNEQWHRAGQSGTLRAVIFGVSDGLVSNTSLVMGVAGAASGDPHFVLLAGIAGLLAGSFSMAAGEYISMQSQRELFERQIALEREELRVMPEQEEAELAAVYRAKGFAPEEAARIAARLFTDHEAALDTLVREELGLDPDELGNPWRAAIGSLLAFGAGAAFPVVPFLFGGGTAVFVTSIVVSLAAMFAVGVGVSLLTGRSALFSGARQVAIGVVAAGVTFLVGRLIGVGVGG